MNLVNKCKVGICIYGTVHSFANLLIRIFFYILCSCFALIYINPIFVKRVHLKLDEQTEIFLILLLIFHVLLTAGVLNKSVENIYKKHQRLLEQLVLMPCAEAIYLFLCSIGWYFYFMVLSFIIVDVKWFYVVETILYCGFFLLCYKRTVKNAVIGKMVRIEKHRMKKADLRIKTPMLELVWFSVFDLYKCRKLVFGKIIFLLFLLELCRRDVLNIGFVMLANTFLILCNDTYWKKESDNFQYLSQIGISIKIYLKIHLVAGIFFNIFLCMCILLFYKNLLEVMILFFVLVYFLFYWYSALIFLYLWIGKEREGTIILLEVLFLCLGLVPIVGLLLIIRFYKKIKEVWEVQ